MVSASFVQTSFLGGEWSPLAQGRMVDPKYKTASNVMFNAQPTEAGAWIRRSGARFMAHTKGGVEGKLRAFDFNVRQPYQIELTAGWMRFFAGLSLLTTVASDGAVYLARVLAQNPVKIVSASPIPAGWANGDTVTFSLATVPVSCTALLGRQFVVANLDTGAQTFTLKDAITGLDVDGTSFVYTPPPDGSAPDQISKVFELATPYTGTLWKDAQAVTNSTGCLLLHNSIQPQLIAKGDIGAGDGFFVVNPQDFTDGPYLDLNPGTVTCTLGGLSGSVSVTFNGTSNVNHGEGLQATDVGRLLRFQGGPPAWAIGTTYAKQATVLGSDTNIYTSITGGNVGHDPTTDDGSHWEISPQTVTWTWLKITAVTNTLTATATIMGDTLESASATTAWQLGLWSDTTGWPQCGVYHEGRLWLSGAGFDDLNRVDGSKSDDFFNFAPTATDGTVAEDNGVSAIFNASDVNAIFWMRSTEDGLILGTQAGEWRIKASALDDPISPTSIQARRVSNYGCANIEPVQPGGQTVFVQRQQRRLLAHEQITAGGYIAVNLTQDADHTTVTGVEEIAWQQEPVLTIWGRLQDGTLLGCTYRKRQYAGFAVEQEAFNGFHRHELANNRNVLSIQGGVAYDGLSDACYMITNQPQHSQPDNGVHWVQVFMPMFDEAQADWAAYFTDGGGTPPYAQLMQVSNGDSFDGVRIFGLWPLNGLTAAPVLGGLDLGDRLVANGICDVPFGSDPDAVFTLAFFQGLSDGTDYGVFAVSTGYIVSGNVMPPVAANNLLAYVGNDATVKGNGGTQFMLSNPAAGEVYQMSIGSTTPGMRKFVATNGVEAAQTARTMSPTTYYFHSNGFIYASTAAGNTVPIEEISTATATFGAGVTYGTTSSSLAGSGPGHFQCMDGTICGFSAADTAGVNHDYLVFSAIRGAQEINEVTLLEVNGQARFVFSTQLTTISSQPKSYVSVCAGSTFNDWATFYALEQPYPGTWPGDNSIQVVLHQYYLTPGDVVGGVPLTSFTPSNFDAAWTTMNNAIGLAFDSADDCLIFLVSTADTVTNKRYIVKYDPWNLAFKWKLALDDDISTFTVDQYLCATRFKGKLVFAKETSGNHNLYVIDTVAGTLTKTATNTGFSFVQNQFYDQASGSITFYGSFTSPGTGPTMTYLGAYLPAHGDNLSNQWGRFYLGTIYPGNNVVTTYTVPMSMGTTYTSDGQLLRPDFGPDAGARNGPAFGKKRRLHQYAAAFHRTRAVSIGTDFSKLRGVLLGSAAGAAFPAPSLFSDTAWGTIDDDYSFNAQLAWRITRPYPCIVTAMGGYIEAMDK